MQLELLREECTTLLAHRGAVNRYDLGRRFEGQTSLISADILEQGHIRAHAYIKGPRLQHTHAGAQTRQPSKVLLPVHRQTSSKQVLGLQQQQQQIRAVLN